MAVGQGIEVWKNVSRGTVVVNKFEDGRRKDFLIHGGKQFDITVDERKIMEAEFADESYNVFRNGTFVPVRLIDLDEAEKSDIESNPNIMTDTDAKELFGLHWKKFDSELNRITSQFVLSRLLELSEDDEIGATVKQQARIRARLEEVAPHLLVPEVNAGDPTPRLPKALGID